MMKVVPLSPRSRRRDAKLRIVVLPAGSGSRPLLSSAVRAGLLSAAEAGWLASDRRVKLGGAIALAPAFAGPRSAALVAVEVPEGAARGRSERPSGADLRRPRTDAAMEDGLSLLARLTTEVPRSERYRQAGAEVAAFLRQQGERSAHVVVLASGDARLAGACAEGIALACYSFDGYRGAPREPPAAARRAPLWYSSDVAPADLARSLARSRARSDAVALARDLTNTPAGDLGPGELERAAQSLARELGLRVRSLRTKALKQLGFGAILGVGQGSARSPRLVVIEYRPAGARCTVALVGKGVTFDSGGLSLKDARGMELMKKDMAGAAACLGALRCAVRLRLPVNLAVVIPAVENMPDGRAQRPGDVVRTGSGKTIEVVNTDAEGRLILADALTFAARFDPDVIVDVATLTGEAGRTFGNVVSPVLGNDWVWIERLVAAGIEAHERVWPLPILDEYRNAMAGDVADLKNSSTIGGYSAGSILGASFLSEFVRGTPWVHLDIANTSWSPSDSGYVRKGATGVGVRLLVSFLEAIAARRPGPAPKAPGRPSRAAAGD
jgi:leucyl aminopeptidase